MDDIAGLVAERSRLIGLLASLPVAGSVSEGGRSVSIDRKGVLDQINTITELIRVLGGPWEIASTAGTAY